MSTLKTLTSSETFEHTTPDDLFDEMDREFGPFTLDPATALGYHTSNVILARGGTVCVQPQEPFEYITLNGGSVVMDGLANEGTGRVWLNPPFSRGLCWKFVYRAYKAVREGKADLVCALIPSRTGLPYWQKYVAQEIKSYTGNNPALRTYFVPGLNKAGSDILRFLPGRLKFGNGKTGKEQASAPFPCSIVVWRK